MKIIRSRYTLFFALITAIVTLLSVTNARANYTILHNFGASGDGREPWGSLIVSGSTLYGMTTFGGSYNQGTLFKMNTDGTGYTILYNFGGFSGDGIAPYSNLILSGSTLYGVTRGGGIYGGGWWGNRNGWYGGTLFKINTNGTGYTILYNFGGSGDGFDVYSSPILSNSTLYGTTPHGGSYGWGAGTLYRINTDGSGYTILRNFPPGSSEGSRPYASPVSSGSTLYGVTVDGGSYGWWGMGTLFKMNTDGTGYTVLHNFGSGDDGGHPLTSPILSGSTLYGTTPHGGTYGGQAGTLFKMNTDGTGYTILHNFGASGDGFHPYSSPTLAGSTLYGVTAGGGNYGGLEWWGGYGAGALFKINTDGTGYTILHNFGGSGDGYEPRNNMVLSGSTLYGMTSGGGSNGGGVLFRYTLSEAAPSTPTEVINTVDTMLASGGITSTAVANAIVSQLSNAQNNLTANPTSAANMISAVINFIEAQSGKKITTESAETLIRYLTDIINGL